MIKKAPSLCFIFLISLFSCKKETPYTDPVLTDPASITWIQKPVTYSINDQVGGYYVAQPSIYDQTTYEFPLLLFLPGAGQFGYGSDDLSLVLKDGPAKLINENKLPATFTVTNQTFALIILTPQLKQAPTAKDVKDCLAYAQTTYRINKRRIYLSGLSAGSIAACNLAAESPNAIAALLPMAGVPLDYASTGTGQRLAAGNLPVWAFHCEDDPQISVSYTKGFISQISSSHPGIPPKLTLWPYGGHDAWTRAVDPAYKENGMNIYEWMLQYHR
jgi:poly(3-hydroxybutyrate) depolymerase